MEKDVEIKVDYLPAAKEFHHEYAGATTLSTVRTDAMSFFQVRDFQDRNNHQFFLEFNHQRLAANGETLAQLLGHHDEAKFKLVEQITPGAH